MSLRQEIEYLEETNSYIIKFGIFLICSGIIVTHLPAYKNLQVSSLIFVGLFCHLLDSRFSNDIECKTTNRPYLSIDKDKFKDSPNKEIARYVKTTDFYSVSWRMCVTISCVLVLLVRPFVQPKYYQFTFHMTIICFCIVYHYTNLIKHHTTRFVHDTVCEASIYLCGDKKIPYEQKPYGKV